jgi:hypothetical protein
MLRATEKVSCTHFTNMRVAKLSSESVLTKLHTGIMKLHKSTIYEVTFDDDLKICSV